MLSSRSTAANVAVDAKIVARRNSSRPRPTSPASMIHPPHDDDDGEARRWDAQGSLNLFLRRPQTNTPIYIPSFCLLLGPLINCQVLRLANYRYRVLPRWHSSRLSHAARSRMDNATRWQTLLIKQHQLPWKSSQFLINSCHSLLIPRNCNTSVPCALQHSQRRDALHNICSGYATRMVAGCGNM